MSLQQEKQRSVTTSARKAPSPIELEVIVFKRNEVGTLRNALFLEKILYKGLKSHVWSENKQNIRLRCVTFAIKQIIK